MRSRFARRILACLALAVVVAAPAHAQRATRGLTPVPSNPDASVEVAVQIDPKEPRIGGIEQICFAAGAPGFVTLWNISTAGQVARIFPNQFSKVGAAAPIEGGRKYCAGSANDPFRFRVDGPTGSEDLYLLWTTRAELQPTAAGYADPDAFRQALAGVGTAGQAEWSVAKLTYDIVPAAGPQAPSVPPPQVNGNVAPPPAAPSPAAPPPAAPPPRQTADAGRPPPPAPAREGEGPKIWILAMGANVDPLTKSNQDARLFTSRAASLFDVPKENIRFFENGTNAQFTSGMEWLADVASPRDFVFIYFSGHGGRFKSSTSSDGWDEFLVPYDFAQANADPKNLLFSQRIAFLINRLQTKNVVAVIDACNSAGVTRALEGDVLGARKKFWSIPGDIGEGAVQNAFAEVMPRTRAAGGRNRITANGLLLAAAHRDQYALEGSNGSLFTLALVEEMNSRMGGSLVDVFTRSVQRTEKMSDNKQDPEAVGDLDLGRKITFDQQ